MSAVESSSITITPRKPPERAQEVALNWHDSPFASQFFNALSLVFPTGEQLFIDAIRHYRKEVTDPTLKAQVKGFLAQEALHRKEHLLVNDLLREQGIDPDSYDAFFRENVKMGKKMRSPLTILAMTVACEHFTAILAHRLLSDPDRYLKPMPKELAELWTWHAQEEIEHKAVAFDVYEAMGGGYMRRILIMLEASVMFGGVVAFITGRLLLKKRLFFQRKTWRDAFHLLFARDGLFRRAAGEYLAFFKPTFHPWESDDRHLLGAHQDSILVPALPAA